MRILDLLNRGMLTLPISGSLLHDVGNLSQLVSGEGIQIIAIISQRLSQSNTIFLLYTFPAADPCAENNGGCSHDCIDDGDGSSHCECHEGFVMNVKGLCSSELHSCIRYKFHNE